MANHDRLTVERTIQRCYARFLLDSNDHDEREYSGDAGPIREVLIHAHYLSQKDIEICTSFDLADEFDTHPNFPGIQSLHRTLRATYTASHTMDGRRLTRAGRASPWPRRCCGW